MFIVPNWIDSCSLICMNTIKFNKPECLLQRSNIIDHETIWYLNMPWHLLHILKYQENSSDFPFLLDNNFPSPQLMVIIITYMNLFKCHIMHRVQETKMKAFLWLSSSIPYCDGCLRAWYYNLVEINLRTKNIVITWHD